MLVVMKKYLLLLLLAGCFTEATPMTEENRSPKAQEFGVQFLFEYEGCRLYRFGDGGAVHYYANCGSSTTTSTEVCVADGNGGQNCSLETTSTGKRK